MAVLEDHPFGGLVPDISAGNESNQCLVANRSSFEDHHAGIYDLAWTSKMDEHRPVLVGMILALSLLLLHALVKREDRAGLDEKGRRPPHRASFSLPLIGHLFSIVWGRTEFISALGGRWNRQPVEIRLLNWDICVLSASDHIASLFKSSRASSLPRQTLPYVAIMSRFAFGAPRGSTDRHKLTSETSTTPAHFALDKGFVHAVATSLSGVHLSSLASRFQNELLSMVRGADISEEWSFQPDLYPFVRHLLFQSATNSMFGRQLLRNAPEFEEEFWKFDYNLWYLVAIFPRWLARAGWGARDRCLDMVAKWQRGLADDPDDRASGAATSPLESPARLIQLCRKFWQDRPGMNERIHAADTLGLVWGLNANTTPLGFWAIFEVVRRPALLERVRQEVMSAKMPEPQGNGLEFDVAALCRSPLLQSIYAEVARLYVHTLHNRGLQGDLQLGPWLLKRDKFVVISTYWMHRDPEIWNTGTAQDPHPVDEFWAERFLIDPNDPNSGPIKPKVGQTRSTTDPSQSSVRFSLDGLGSMWLPYGGGESICPGRFFAKQEIILGLAITVANFDIELLPGYTTEMDMWQLGLGTTIPRGSAPFKIRRRS